MPPAASLPHSVSICEVGLRDGLQSLQTVMPTAAKREWVRRAYEAGLREIEVGSFVPPKLLPQMADTADIVAYALTLPDLAVTTLVPNLKGAQRARECGVHQIVLPISASLMHSQANVRKTPDEMIDELRRIVADRNAAGSPMRVSAGIGTAFGCGIQGDVDPREVLRLLRAALDSGADGVGLADTIGYADPLAVRRLFAAARDVAGDRLWTAHFHDTRGLGLANVYAALEVGITNFDSSLAGIGGCPFAPGASGNVSTEDLVFMLDCMGVSSGVDVGKLLDLREFVARHLPGEALYGVIARAGLPKNFRPLAA